MKNKINIIIGVVLLFVYSFASYLAIPTSIIILKALDGLAEIIGALIFIPSIMCYLIVITIISYFLGTDIGKEMKNK